MPSTNQSLIVLAPVRTRTAWRTDWTAEVKGLRAGSIHFSIGGTNFPESEAHNDAFVLPAYLYALHVGAPIHFDFPISQRLIANIADALGPLLVGFAKDLFPKPIQVSAKGLLWGSETGKRVIGSATGMSCGLDSFATVRYAQSFPTASGRRLAALGHFDVGNHNPRGGPDSRLYVERSIRAAIVAERIGLPLIDVQSNVGEWVPGGFARLHTLRNAAAAYLTYPCVGTYVYSNGVRITDTSLVAKDSAYIDALLMPLLSTAYLEFVQGTPAWGAPEKTKAILDDSLAQEHLNVCYFESQNCGVCEKCLRRALLIDSFGRLDDFAKVFNGRIYRENKDWYIGYVLMRANDSSVMRELADHLQQCGYLAKGITYYRRAWLRRRAENWILRRLGRPRRPL